MTIEEIGLHHEIKGMYLLGENISSIIKTYGIALFRYEIINALDSIKVELTSEEIRTRKLNKAKIKLGRLHRKCNILYSKELKHDERARHFKTKKLIIEQSITKLHACIDKLNTL